MPLFPAPSNSPLNPGKRTGTGVSSPSTIPGKAGAGTSSPTTPGPIIPGNATSAPGTVGPLPPASIPPPGASPKADAALILSLPPQDYYSGVSLGGTVTLSSSPWSIVAGLNTDGTLNGKPKYTGEDALLSYVLSYSGTRWQLAITQREFFSDGIHNWSFYAAVGSQAAPDLANWSGGSASAEASGYPVVALGSGGTSGVPGQMAIVNESFIFVCLRSAPVKWQGPLQIIY